MNWQLPRSIYSVSLMCDYAAELGLPVELCLEGSDIARASLTDSALAVRPSQELVVMSNLVRHLGTRPGLFLDLGARVNISAWGVVAFVLSSCSHVRELIQLGQRFASLTILLTDRTYIERDGEFHIRFRDEHLPEPLRPYILDRDLAAMFNLYRELFPVSLPMRHAQMRYPRPAHAALYRERFGFDMQFGADDNLLVLDTKMLDLPLPKANRHALRYWEREVQQLLEQRCARSGMSGKVRQLLTQRPLADTDMEQISTELGTTSRNLRRLLDAEGTSFRALIEELRQTLAEELLTSGQLSVAEVSDRLGYREPTSFNNAFKRWKGVSPTDWARVNQPRGAIKARTS